MFGDTWEDFQKRQAELNRQVEEKLIADVRTNYPLTVGEYLRQHFLSDESGFLDYHTDIPANYSINESKGVFWTNYTSCTWTLSDGQIASFAYYVDPKYPLVLWYTYPQKDPNEPSIRTFEQVPDAQELASKTLLSSAEAVNLLEMTNNITDINQAAWMSLNGKDFTAICTQLFHSADSPDDAR